jgi:adenine-specific DNA-methyltransferase
MGADFLERVEFLRLEAGRGLDGKRKSDLGQFLTPTPVARLLASMLVGRRDVVRILDAGAGVGSLGAAAVAELCGKKAKPKEIRLTAYEIDPHLAPYIRDTFRLCQAECRRAGVRFAGELVEGDFIEGVAASLGGLLADAGPGRFTCAILNPPYRKINVGSRERRCFREMGIETSNLYTGFLALAVRLLDPGGELVAITPRSFCNGRYFRGFRESFLRQMELRRLHVFESRQQAFRDDEVLQENVIVHAVKRSSPGRKPGKVAITSSAGPDDELPLLRQMPYEDVVRPGDAEFFIHIAADDLGQHVTERMGAFQSSLADLGLTVSTGRVVEFRAKEYLRDRPGKGTAPLIWPGHFAGGTIRWPRKGYKKPQAIVAAVEVADQLVPNEHYVLVRRFSAKEERRRVVAAVYDADRVACRAVGFENHLNYFHKNGGGLDLALARGLAVYLNSTLVDSYFRQFNGHTQVNATDLRSLRYPSAGQLRALGDQVGPDFPDQARVDALMVQEFPMAQG